MITQEQIIRALTQELKRVQMKNLQLRTHMDVLVRTPRCKTAKRICLENEMADFADATIHLN